MRKKSSKHMMSFEVDDKFLKYVEHRAGCLGLTVSEMVRNALLFDGIVDCDGKAFELLSDKIRSGALGLYKRIESQLNLVAS